MSEYSRFLAKDNRAHFSRYTSRNIVSIINNAPKFCTLIHGKQYAINARNEPHLSDIEALSIDIRIPDIAVCQDLKTDDCKLFVDQMLKCQQIVFNDRGYSYQQYERNIQIHKQILVKYQSICESANNDYTLNDAFDL